MTYGIVKDDAHNEEDGSHYALSNLPEDPAGPEAEAPEQAEAEAEDAPSEDAETVTLVASNLPFFVRDFRLPQEDGGMLSFDRHGTEVPSEDADRLTQDAADNGVALTRKAN